MLNIVELIKRNREFLKADLWEEWKLKNLKSDQRMQLPQPPLQKPYPQDAALVDLVSPEDFTVGKMPLIEAINRRVSRREFSDSAFTVEEFSFLLWATQGVKKLKQGGTATLRTVPSGGARHPFETYLLVKRVEDLQPGLYRYLALEHKLYPLDMHRKTAESIYDASLQDFVRNAAIVFIWTTIPYRMEWRYSFLAHKVIAQETGHICQNLYLACESIRAGACALGTYHQHKMDDALGIDGEDEFTIYLAVTGKLDN